MSSSPLQLVAGGQTIALPGVPEGTAIHIHLHIGSAGEDRVSPPGPAARREPEVPPHQPTGRPGRSWLAPLGAAAVALVIGYGFAGAAHRLPERPVPADPTMVDQERQEATAMRTLDRQLHQQPTVTPPAGQQAPASGTPTARPFGLEN